MIFSIVLTLFILILINAFYVAAEFAAIGVQKSKIEALADNGNALARHLLPNLTDPIKLDRFIAACQIGITISSLVLGAVGESRLAGVFVPVLQSVFKLEVFTAQTASSFLVLGLLTSLQIVIGELVPKALALQFSTQVALVCSWPMAWSMKVFSGFIGFLNGIAHSILKLVGFPMVPHHHIHSSEEIEVLLAESREGGLIEPDEHRRLSRALRLGAQQVSEIMVPRSRIQALDISSDLSKVVEAFTKKPFTRLPVYDGSIDRILGFVHARDVALHRLTGQTNFVLKRLLRPIMVVSSEVSTEELLTKMREERKQLAIVKTPEFGRSKPNAQFGKTVGLVGISDILDEFLGDVSESAREKSPQAQLLPDGRLRVPASMTLDEARECSGVPWHGVESVGSKVVDSLGFLPAPGDRVVVDGVEIEISRSSRRFLESVLVQPINKNEEVSSRPGAIESGNGEPLRTVDQNKLNEEKSK